jgi:hypothetical protein
VIGLVEVDFFMNGGALNNKSLDVNVGAVDLLPRFRDELADAVVDFVQMLFPLGGVVNVRVNFGEQLQEVVILLKLFHQLCGS